MLISAMEKNETGKGLGECQDCRAVVVLNKLMNGGYC